MEVSDGTREKKILERAKQLTDEWMASLENDLLSDDERDSINGIALAAHMTAAYSLYSRLKAFVKSQGGYVSALDAEKINK